MVELLFVTCMIGALDRADQCQERSLLFNDVTPQACIIGAQPQLAKWVVTHPGHRIQSWNCRTVSMSEREA